MCRKQESAESVMLKIRRIARKEGKCKKENVDEARKSPECKMKCKKRCNSRTGKSKMVKQGRNKRKERINEIENTEGNRK